MANPTYKLISSYTTGSGGTGSIVFSSIPQTYKDLVLVVSARTNGSTGPSGICRTKLQINSSTTGYSNVLLYSLANATPTNATGSDQITFFYSNSPDATAQTFSNTTIYLNNYTSAFNKVVSCDSATEYNTNSGGIRAFNAGMLSTTSPITSLTITPSDAVVFTQYSTAYLYGIKNS